MIKKIPVNRLAIGMYLCGNDRKWLETPFFRSKFLVKTEHQIAGLREYCKFVFIDTKKGIDVPEQESPTMINDMQGFTDEGEHSLYPVGSIVELNNGQLAIVEKAGSVNPSTPSILLITDTNKNVLTASINVNFADTHTEFTIVRKLDDDDPLVEFINLLRA